MTQEDQLEKNQEDKKDSEKVTKQSESNKTKQPKEAIPSQEAKVPSELDETKDRLLRLAAEFDNYKKRVSKENEELKSISKAELIKKIIPVLDEFELAIDAMSDSKNDEHMVKGMELIYSNLSSALKNEGLSVIETEGVYDPYKHEIIMTKESEKKPGTILDVVRKGYQFNGLLVRPASVIVAKEDTKKQQTSE